MLGMFLATVVIMALLMAGMAVGVIVSRGKTCIRGTCGGDQVVGKDGEDLLCDSCPKRKSRECLPDSEREAACEHRHDHEAAGVR